MCNNVYKYPRHRFTVIIRSLLFMSRFVVEGGGEWRGGGDKGGKWLFCCYCDTAQYLYLAFISFTFRNFVNRMELKQCYILVPTLKK